MKTWIKHLYLKNFRNYSEKELSFSDRINLFLGANGQGKTNLLEAIYLISTGRSFRTEKLSDLIYSGEKAFFVEGILEKDGVEHRIQISFDGEQKKLLLNNNSYTTLQQLLGVLPSVLHTPWDGELIEGPPAIRRRFLNIHLAQSDLLYVHHLSRFWRALKQRNTLLKLRSIQGIECWEEEMALSAAYLQNARRQLLNALLSPLTKIAPPLSQDTPTISYQPSAADQYLAQLKKHRDRELYLGTTLIGPHRDDFDLSINQKNAKDFASEGQKRTLTTALRLAEWHLLSESIGTGALLGIDDFGVQLDAKRRAHLIESMSGFSQVFITTPEMELPGASVHRL